MIGAALGSATDRDEATLARRLLPLLHPSMLVLLDRAFDADRVPRRARPAPARSSWCAASPPAGHRC